MEDHPLALHLFFWQQIENASIQRASFTDGPVPLFLLRFSFPLLTPPSCVILQLCDYRVYFPQAIANQIAPHFLFDLPSLLHVCANVVTAFQVILTTLGTILVSLGLLGSN